MEGLGVIMEELLRLLLVRPAEAVDEDESDSATISLDTESDFNGDIRQTEKPDDRLRKAREFMGTDKYVSDVTALPHAKKLISIIAGLTKEGPGDENSLKLRIAGELHGDLNLPEPQNDDDADSVLAELSEAVAESRASLKDSVLAVREFSGSDNASQLEELSDLLRGIHLVDQLQKQPAKKAATNSVAATFVLSGQAKEEPRSNPDLPTVKESDEAESVEGRLERVSRALDDLRSLEETALKTEKIEDKKLVGTEKPNESKTRTASFSFRQKMQEKKFINRRGIKVLPEQTRGVIEALDINLERHTYDDVLSDLRTERKMLSMRVAKKSNNLRIVNGIKFHTPMAADPLFKGVIEKLPKPFLPGHIKPLRQVSPAGIGDLLVVRQHLKRYQGGDLAHVENVLQGEYKDREHRRRRATEEIITVETEKETTDERETQTTSRFELRSEVQQQVQEETAFKAGLTVNAKYGPFVEVEANAEFSYKNAKQESRQRASSLTQEVVERAKTRFTERVREERTRKIVEEVEEINRHGIDAKTADGHIVGMYQWLNKVYKAQVYNYGLRVMYDLMIPEPAAYYLWATAKNADDAAPDLIPPPDFNLRPNNIDGDNFDYYASVFEAEGLSPPPDEFITIELDKVGGPSEDKTVFHVTDSVTIPSGYRYYSHSTSWYYTSKTSDDTHDFNFSVGDNYSNPGTVPIRCSGYDITGFSIYAHIRCKRTWRRYEEWRQSTWDALYQAHLAQVAKYEERLAQVQIQEGIHIEGRNPLGNRKIERNELKKHAITLLTGKTTQWMDAINDVVGGPRIDLTTVDSEARYARFFEQAFEWENMSYIFYPYFWARAKKWRDLMGVEYAADPQFEDFLTAGYARVVVPVRPGFEPAVEHYRQTGKIWSGGKLPTITDPDYLPIVEELKARLNAPGSEEPVGEPWEVELPTQLVKLRETPTLPRWDQDEDGNWFEVLPEAGDNED